MGSIGVETGKQDREFLGMSGCKTIQAKNFPDLPEPLKFCLQLPLFPDLRMSRRGCSRRPPLNRDQAILPITQRCSSRHQPTHIMQRSEELSAITERSESSVDALSSKPEMPAQMAIIYS
jgi:hypothetical protein